jgi:hypothetical protein
MLLLFLRHNASKLGMQVRRLFFMGASERSEGTIVIHRREGQQSKQGCLLDQGENLRHSRLRAEFGLGQDQIDMA